MRFRAVHKLMSYLLAAASVATLTTSGSVPTATLALLVSLGIVSWFVEPGTAMGQLLDRAGLVFNVVALAFFGLSLFQVFESFPEPEFGPILNVALFLLGYKLFHRRSNRDYLWIYVLSFVLILVAAWLAQTVFFVVGFVAYVVLATWTLILFHLRREIEDNYLVKHLPEAGSERVTAARVLNSRRVVGPSFFVMTGLLALGVFVGAALVFALVPRIGLGFFSGSLRRKVNIVGFSDEVTLGHHGVISGDNDTVVLWVRSQSLEAMDDENRRLATIQQFYWRGTVYDTYLNGQWVRSRAPGSETFLQETAASDGSIISWVRHPEAPFASRPHSEQHLAALDLQEINVVGLSHPVAFALDEPMAFRMPPPAPGSFSSLRVERRHGGEVALRALRPGSGGLSTKDFSGARYFAYSRSPMARPPFGQGRPIADLQREKLLDNYFQAPQSLSPRVKDLAVEITKGAIGPMAKAIAISEWLRKTHSYTTDLKRDPRIEDPLEDFLFHQTAGHCEYFASATAVLLRLAGVPSRYVNGFLGGEWNSLGKYLAVRDNRAHSWAEAYLGPAGWVRIDSTPAAGASSRMGRLREIVDSIEFYWSRWIIDYDVSRQVEIARRIGGQERRAGGRVDLSGLKNTFRWLATILVVVVAVIILVRRWRNRVRGERPFGRRTRASRLSSGVFALYDAAVGRLGKRGFRRDPGETPREFAARLVAASLPGAPAFGELTELYSAARFGEREVPAEVLTRLEPEVARVGREMPPQDEDHPAAA
jgi:transglutaminase-like putative cysteine protease